VGMKPKNRNRERLEGVFRRHKNHVPIPFAVVGAVDSPESDDQQGLWSLLERKKGATRVKVGRGISPNLMTCHSKNLVATADEQWRVSVER
jgi:hypothetical protein